MTTFGWIVVALFLGVFAASERPLGAEVPIDFSDVEAAVVVADMVGVLERDWPAAHTRLAIAEGSGLAVALEARLRGAGYAVAAGEGLHEVVELVADRIGGLDEYRIGLRVGDDWRLDRRYAREASGRLRAATGFSLRGGRGVRGPLERPAYELRAERREAAAVEVLHVWHVELDRGADGEALAGRRTELERLGLPALLVNQGASWALRAGPFRDVARAREVAELLRVSGYVNAELLDVTESRMGDVPDEAPDEPIPEGAERCGNIRVESGSLRINAGRLLEECGYRLGRWELGDSGELEDLIIPVAYELRVEGEVWGLLAFLEEAYGVVGRVRELDGAVDFEWMEDGS